MSKLNVSRRALLKKGAAAVGTGTVTLFGSHVPLAASPVAPAFAQAPAVVTRPAGRKYRAYVARGTVGSVQEVTLAPIGPRRVVVRTQAAQCCYSDTGRALGAVNLAQATVLGHGGIGVVEEVGSQVQRVQVGDRVIVANTAQCGECYNCLRGRADHCLVNGLARAEIGTLNDGTPVVQWNNEGGYSEYMVPFEERVVPIFSTHPAHELAILHCVGVCGLGATMTLAPIEVASDVVVFGAGPLGLSAIQGARIKGATQIIAVEPIRARRELALKVGATAALDPNAEGAGLVEKIQRMCQGKSPRAFAGGGNVGPDWVMEAVGGDQFPPKAEAGPDPTGVLSLKQAWDVCSEIGKIVTVGINQKGNFALPAGQWSNGAKNHFPGNMAGSNSKRDLPRFVRLIESGQFNAKDMVTSTFSLDRTRDAFQAAADRTTIASVIVFS